MSFKAIVSRCFRPLDRAADLATPVLFDSTGLYCLLGLYFLLLWSIRAFLFASGAPDDVEQLLFSQSFEPGYQFRNPPLFTWLVIALQSLAGINLAAVLLLKFASLFLFFVLLHRLALAILDDRPLAALTALAAFGLYHVFWVFVVTFSHSALLSLACVATLWAALRLDRSGRTICYVALGAVAGAGLMTKHNYAIFLAATAGAALMDGQLRSRLADRRSLLTLAIALAIALPHYLWLYGHSAEAIGVAGGRLNIGDTPSRGVATFKGLLTLVTSSLGFLLPLIALLPAFFWRSYRQPRTEHSEARRYARLLERAMALIVAAMAAMVIVTAAERIRVHYMAVLAVFPLWAFARLRLLGADERAKRRFAVLMTVIAACVPPALVVRLLTDPLREQYPDYNIPIPQLAARLAAAGFEHGTVLDYYYPYDLSAALRPYFPDSRFTSMKYTHFIPPQRPAHGQCLLIWTAGLPYDDELVGFMPSAAGRLFGFDVDAAPSQMRRIELPMAFGNGQTLTFQYRLYPDGPGTCH